MGDPQTHRTIYFDCFVGASGDMILGVLVDLGLSLNDLAAEMMRLPMTGYHLQSRRVAKHGIGATKVDVVLDEDGGHEDHHGHGDKQHGRSYRDIVDMIEGSDLSEGAKERSLAVFARLGKAEAKIHGKPLDEIHFHEVGAVDSVVDIVGAAIGLEMLGVAHVLSSPMPLSHGVVRCEHGLLPVPAPATLEVLVGVPTRSVDVEGETLTPTGAAILATLSERFGAMPPMTIERIGYGAGTRDWPEMPNVLRACMGELQTPAGPLRETIHLVEANIDDMSGELLGHATDRVFEAGAVDVFTTPIFMKKGRPATKLSALVHADRLDAVVDAFLRETTTFGVRATQWERYVLDREHAEIQTPLGMVRVKLGRLGGDIVTATPEYEDCRRLAEESGIPLRRVYREAQRAAADLM